MASINVRIRKLFHELDTMDTSFDSSGERYWDIKLALFREITHKYGTEYSPETVNASHIPSALVTIVLKMEREIANI
jgi:hypothetical protein